LAYRLAYKIFIFYKNAKSSFFCYFREFYPAPKRKKNKKIKKEKKQNYSKTIEKKREKIIMMLI
jgi:hypothetical protein